MVFKEEDEREFDKISFIRNEVGETRAALKRDLFSTISNIKKQEIFINRSPPPYGWLALNTDRAAKGCPGLAGAGGILRDHRGRCVGFFSANLGNCIAIRAELMALKKGLMLALEQDAMQVDVRMDNLAYTQIINMDESYVGPNLQLVKQCKELIAQHPWIVTILHCYREANRAADWLANRGVVLELPMDFGVHPPSELARIIWEDNSGFSFPRVINM